MNIRRIIYLLLITTVAALLWYAYVYQPTPVQPEITTAVETDIEVKEKKPTNRKKTATPAKKASSQKPAEKKTTPVKTADTIAKKAPVKTNAQTRTISVHNGITKKMLTYKYLFMKYKPSSLSILVNGQELEQDVTQNITLVNNQLTIELAWEFLNGKRTGARTIIFEILPGVDTIELTFNWKEKQKVLIDEDVAKVISVEEPEEQLSEK